MNKSNQRGFTIIELLIAMSIFTIILLVLTGAVVQIGRLYYKSLTASRTQEVARTVIDDLSRAIQYTPGVVKTNLVGPGENRGVCVGSRRYTFVQGRKIDQDVSIARALVSDEDLTGCTTTLDLNSSTTGSELLADKMRVSKLTIQDSTTDSTLATGVYRVNIRVIYGDDDLLCRQVGNFGGSGADCFNDIPMTAAEISSANDLQCKNIRSGTQFCAASELSTIVERRLQ